MRSAPAEAEAGPERSAARPSRAARHAERPERPERRLERHRRQRRLADTPPVQAAPVPPAARPEPRLSDWAGTAQGLVADYFDAVSAPGPAIVASAPASTGIRCASMAAP
ncbi:hypothetical protein [Methylobacterium gregans]|uniref:hypothetical protein n=1 Tax=Methylobacterium gregans TaxID=374424 RepID=UPI003615CA01